MSFRSSAAKGGGVGMPASSDQSKAIDGTKRSQDGDAGSTAPPKRSTRFRIPADMSPALVDADNAPIPSYAQSQAQVQAQVQGQARRPLPPSFTQLGMSINDQHIADNSQNAAQKPFLQTRRRQPSTSNAKLPLGPRPQVLQTSTPR